MDNNNNQPPVHACFNSETFGQLTNIVSNLISERMIELNLYAEGIDGDRVSLLFNCDIFLQVLNQYVYNMMIDHSTIDDNKLASILNLIPSTVADLNKRELYYLISLWTEDNLYPELTEYWTCQLIENPTSNIYVRYVGMCRAPTRPIDRMADDFKHRNNGVFASFMRFITNIDLSNIDISGNVYYFVNGPLNINQDFMDQTEQLVINFFGLNSLMNSQPGGHNTRYRPGDVAFQAYQNLNPRPNFFQTFQIHSTVIPEVTRGNNMLQHHGFIRGDLEEVLFLESAVNKVPSNI